MVDLVLVLTAIDVFLIFTFLGIFIYLLRVYQRWTEPSIGFWSAGSLLVSLAVIFHLLSIVFLNQENSNISKVYYQIALMYSFFAIWSFSISHIIARRDNLDLLAFQLISIALGGIIVLIWFELNYVVDQNVMIIDSVSISKVYRILISIFYLLVYLFFLRDSYLMYKASNNKYSRSYRRSVALTHFLAWQFWLIGIITLQANPTNLTQIRFILPFIFLLVPILTLGSRPFDWAREGFEPVMLLLIDDVGSAIFSWTLDSDQQLYLEAATIGGIRSMLENFTNEKVTKMRIGFENTTLYAKSTNGYLSLLLTTGSHKSFEVILERIHLILVSSIFKSDQVELISYALPSELKWLLKQLLPIDFDQKRDNPILSNNFI